MYFSRVEVLTALLLKIQDLWNVMLCHWVYSSQCTEGSYCFLARLLYRWMHYQSWEQSGTIPQWHSITSWNTWIFKMHI